MHIKRSIIAALVVLAGAACGSLHSPSIPDGRSSQPLHAATPDKRGTMKFYNDQFGDATPDGIVAGPDGALWFTDSGNGVVGRITTSGTYTLQQFISGSGISDGITVGPDKNLWFTLGSGGVGRMKTDGTFTLFQDPSASSAEGITTGPDGALWFAESGGMVGRVTTQGTFSHFSVAPSTAQLQGIVTSPDGNLWVTQATIGGSRFSNQVIRVTPHGKHTAYTVGSGPAWICVGPDQALWFTERDANAIGRLTTAGKYTEFSTNYEYGDPSGIATGPDKALWFSDFNGRFGIGRITTAGKISFYGSPSSGAELRQITPGPDGRMWFTSYLGPSGIGRIATH